MQREKFVFYKPDDTSKNFVGIPKIQYFQSFANKVKNKLATQKGKSLSMMKRIQASYLVISSFTATVFKFDQKLCFVQIVNINKSRLVNVNWNTICSSKLDEGL